MPTLRELLAHGEALLKARGVDSPRLSAELLAAHALGCERLQVVTDLNRTLAGPQADRLRTLLDRRAAGEPAAYILAEREFYGLPFAVSPAVLIPRPETELLVDAVLAHFPRDAAFRFADLGTGSGILAVTLAHLFPRSRGLAVDRSPEALAQAAGNARLNGVEDRLSLVRADFTRPFLVRSGLDLVVSNPPYLSEAEYREVSPEVSGFEPRQALVAGPAGDECLEPLLPLAGQALRPGGLLLVEFGWTQGPRVLDLVTACGLFARAEVRRDLAGLPRMLLALRAEW